MRAKARKSSFFDYIKCINMCCIIFDAKYTSYKALRNKMIDFYECYIYFYTTHAVFIAHTHTQTNFLMVFNLYEQSKDSEKNLMLTMSFNSFFWPNHVIFLLSPRHIDLWDFQCHHFSLNFFCAMWHVYCATKYHLE